MIEPVKGIAPSFTSKYQSNPVVQQAQRAYRDTVNPAYVGEKLNINCNDQRYVVREHRRLDYIA